MFPSCFLLFDYNIFRKILPPPTHIKKRKKRRIFKDFRRFYRQLYEAKNMNFPRSFLPDGVLFPVRFLNPAAAILPVGKRSASLH
jgi:hypothetical protein